MSKRWIQIILLISLAFNLAVLGSFVFIRFYFRDHGCPVPPPPLAGGKPGGFIPPEIMQRIKGDTDFLSIRDSLDSKRRLLMRELAKDPIDEPKIQSILQDIHNKQTAFEQKMASELIAFRKNMTADEAKEFFTQRAERIMPRRFDHSHKNFQQKRRRK